MRKELLGIEHFVAAEEESKRETLRKAYQEVQQLHTGISCLAAEMIQSRSGPRQARTVDPRIKSTLFPYPPLSCLVQ